MNDRGYSVKPHTGDPSCSDDDECEMGIALCDFNANCYYAPGSYKCECIEGFTGPGTTCRDINECLERNGGCAQTAACVNMPGSFRCICDEGFEGNGFDCVEKPRTRIAHVVHSSCSMCCVSLYRDCPDGFCLIDKIAHDSKSKLGTGSMGTCVYKGLFDGTCIAVKRVWKGVPVSYREVTLLKECRHDNTVRYLYKAEDTDYCYIAMDLCDATLKDLVESDSKPDKWKTLNNTTVVKQMTLGLDYVHTDRIVHRDLKPTNVLLSLPHHGTVTIKLSDFGHCRRLPTDESSFSRSEDRGTRGWRAPELNDENAMTTRMVDLFSLGCLFNYVLTGVRHPFGGKKKRPDNIAQKVVKLGDLPSDDKIASTLILRMININPRERPTTKEVLANPIMWSKEKIMDFFESASDHIMGLGSAHQTSTLMEQRGKPMLTHPNWSSSLHVPVVKALTCKRSYDHKSIVDLLRAVRNMVGYYSLN